MKEYVKRPFHYFGDETGVEWLCREGEGPNGTDELEFVTCTERLAVKTKQDEDEAVQREETRIERALGIL